MPETSYGGRTFGRYNSLGSDARIRVPAQRGGRTMGGHCMSTADSAPAAMEAGDPTEQRVTPLELFFDLVFVFALTQVTGFLADHLTWVGMIQGAALLAALWWAWGGYSWLTMAVPDAFGEYGIIFGSAYFVVRLLQVLLYALATGGTPETRRAILRLSTGFLLAPALLIVAGYLDGLAQGALWAVALAIDYGVALIVGVSGFRVHAGHSWSATASW